MNSNQSHQHVGHSRPFLVGCCAGLLITAFAIPSHADRLFYKGGKVLEGLVQEQYPSRIKFLYRNRSITIPRSRIEKIEFESGSGAIQALLTKAGTAMENGDLDQAASQLSEADTLNGPGGAFRSQIQELQGRLSLLRARGSAEQRRIEAERLLAEARQMFNKIKTQRGYEYLIQALKVDSTCEDVHDEMARYMNRYQLPIGELTDYFCDRIDIDLIKPDYPVIARLPQIYEDVIKKYRESREPEQIELQANRLKKISAAFEAHPTWAANANSFQSGLIARKSDGLIEDQIREDLSNHRYNVAMARLRAWAGPETSDEIARLYARTWIGLDDLDQARQVLENAKQTAVDSTWFERQARTIGLVRQTREAIRNGNDADAKARLAILFTNRQDLLPEVYGMVTGAKASYDLTDMRAAEASDPTAAADLALTILSYNSDSRSRAEATAMFKRVALQLRYQFVFDWMIDGQSVPLHSASTDAVAALLVKKFNLQFDDESPFTFTLQLITGTNRFSGGKIVAAASDESIDAYSNDTLETDDFAKSLEIHIIVKYNQFQTPLLDISAPVDKPADGSTLGRVGGGETAFFDITALADLDGFINTDLALYLKPDIAIIGNLLNIEEAS